MSGCVHARALAHAPARAQDITGHFTHARAQAAYAKTVKIHKKLPPGGILIFVTGQAEVKHLVRRLQRREPRQGQFRVDIGCASETPRARLSRDLRS